MIKLIDNFPNSGGFDKSFNILFSVMPIFFIITFLFIFGMIIFIIIKNIGKGIKNDRSPTLTVDAKVLAKRTQYNSHHHMHNSTTDTNLMDAGYNTFYITFQFSSGDRLELSIDSSDYGYLIEGDNGKLTFKGTKYISFERNNI